MLASEVVGEALGVEGPKALRGPVTWQMLRGLRPAEAHFGHSQTTAFPSSLSELSFLGLCF